VKIILQSILCLSTILLASCNTTRVVKPLEKGETRIAVDLGGPVVGFPIPMSSISGAYGISEKLSVFGGFHTTTLAYQSLQFDVGANYSFLETRKWQPGISGSLILNPIIDMRAGNSSLFPETAFNLYWQVRERHVPFVGLTNWYDVAKGTVELEKGKLMHPALYLGYNYEGPKWIFGIEAKWLNFNKTLMIPQVDHISIGGKGAAGVYLKVAYRIFKTE
jgi:hypothetical protein